MANITIEIIEGTKDSKNPKSGNKINVANEMLNADVAKTENMLAKSVVINKAYDLAKQTITNAAEIGINRRVTLTENYILGYTWENVKQTIHSTIQLSASVVAGFTVAGPVGAVAAMAGFAVDKGIAYYNKIASISREINTANYNMAFQQTRMTLVNNSRGTEN